MDLLSLRYFVEIVRQRSLSKAAISLGLVQPALTRRIKLLEEQLGAELLMRHRRGVEPTETGLLVLERAELMLRISEQLEAEVRSQAAELIGQVGLGFPPSIGILFVGKILSDCIARYPHLKLFLQEDFSPAVRDALLSGRIDIGIMSSEAQHPDLVGEPLFTESMWLIGRPEDWPIKGRRLGLDKLDRLPIVIGSFTRLLLERLQARSNFQLRVVAEVDSLTTAIGALRAGAGFLVVPFSSVDRELQKKELVGAPIDGFAITRSLFRHRDRPPTRASTALTGLIHDEVSRLISSQPDVFRRFRAS
ncbi:LysR family nitrogen assimilation transcriptional regulator [Beijerinckia sp. GAS462]|nr:LysR family nitrogen assimilation transcriptional regulator [Beijerinckia sp. GAS462]SEC10988.1 LysR family transcriptional regulator, nitrogen assimilation regulatory protein [Beijerinckia sp. 28-YEA-48]